MRKVLFILFALTAIGFSQTVTVHKYDGFKMILDSTTAVSTTEISTSPIEISGSEGIANLWIEVMETSSPGDITVNLEIYNKKIRAWGEYYDGGGDLCTVTASGLSAGDNIYIPLSSSTFSAWATGDEHRFNLKTASGSLKIRVYIAAQ